jgi:hypothetical protein
MANAAVLREDDGMVQPAAAAVLDVPLQTMTGATTTLRAQLGPSGTVAVFLRHFG